MNDDAQTINAEQAADFAALQAAAADAPALPGQEADVIAPRDLGKELTGLIGVTVAALSPMFPSLATTYTPEVTEAAGNAIGAVCDKHGWLAGGMFGEYGEEIACLAICGPLALATYQGVSHDIAARKKAEPVPERIAATVQAGAVPQAEAPANPAAKTVSFGAPVPVAA